MESFNTAQEAAGHPLAERLFSIAGVTNVFILPDFLTVTKETGAPWDTIVSGVEAVIEEVVERR